jgi:hypothetical protein
MNRVIKKKFKCKLCKNRYPITDDMLRTIEIIELCDHPHYNRAFSCPICGQVYAFDTNGFGEYSWAPVFMEFRMKDKPFV